MDEFARVIFYMALTTNDLEEIRNIVDSGFAKQNIEVIEPLRRVIEGMKNDIKDIYYKIANL